MLVSSVFWDASFIRWWRVCRSLGFRRRFSTVDELKERQKAWGTVFVLFRPKFRILRAPPTTLLMVRFTLLISSTVFSLFLILGGFYFSSIWKVENPFFVQKNEHWISNNFSKWNQLGSSKSNNKSGFSSQPPSTVTSSSNPSSFTLPSSSNGSSLPVHLTEGEILSSSNVAVFAFSELKNATRNFRPDSLLGEGGFGYVYKGWIDEQTLLTSKPGYGIAVAIKKLKPESFQGQKEWLVCSSRSENFLLALSWKSFKSIHSLQAEVRYLGQLHHPNLVRLTGYCSDGDNRLLVYEFMLKGSLENHLFRSK